MPRKKCYRVICGHPGITYYKPAGIPLRSLDEVTILLDEFEAIRLADGMGLYHADAAMAMKVSRQTFGRIVSAARKKVADALINGKAIRIHCGDENHINLKDENNENSGSNKEQ